MIDSSEDELDFSNDEITFVRKEIIDDGEREGERRWKYNSKCDGSASRLQELRRIIKV